ncbi:MAG: bifunctional pyr operon transcriptional regulator/uracil phosphoribosyltransferase PyrR, partial [Actinomycetota bacterium]
RGPRALPLRADVVGQHRPTPEDDDVRVRLTETDGADDGIELWSPAAVGEPGAEPGADPGRGAS